MQQLMPKHIDADVARFKNIVKGHVRKELDKYITSGELIGRKGKDTIRIPIPHLQIPRFVYDDNSGIGAGTDPGKNAGNKPGEHPHEAEITLEELTDIFAEELELPRPRQGHQADGIKERTTIGRTGPLRSFKRTYQRALKRQVMTGYNPGEPVIPIRDDIRYRRPKPSPQPSDNAVIIYMMDVSGSMGEREKEIVRLMSFWIELWLKRTHNHCNIEYIIHCTEAKRVDQYTYYHTKEDGGTRMSAAYKLCLDIVKKEYPPDKFNIYPFHYTDGQNQSDDTPIALNVLRELVPLCNQFSYAQVIGAGNMFPIKTEFAHNPCVVVHELGSTEDVKPALKTFLGKIHA